MALSATYFGSSGWLIQFEELRILIDPWLRGDLFFPPGRWLIEGKLKKELDLPKEINLILLTQGLADHAHRPSLECFSRTIPIVGSAAACKLAKSIGFEDIFELNPGKIKKIFGLEIEATAGAAVPNIENGYLLSHLSGSIYTEPHGFLDEKILPRKIDAVITPVINLKLPFLGSFIQGKKVLPELIKRFKPLTILSSTTGGEADFSGILDRIIAIDGDLKEASKYLDKKTKFIEPLVGHRYNLETHSSI
tara:strand:- start:41 stop:790 length:750 start_codon:yes stop_codon:yes gene_type:complete